MAKTTYLNAHQTDILREITNIASGNAATALSQILKKKITMSVPEVELKRFSDLTNKIGKDDEIVVATLLKVLGDISGNVLLVAKEKNANHIAYSLLQGLVSEYDDDMVLSVFQEIGNILGNSYLNSMGTFLGINILSSIPYISVDMLFPIVSSAYIDANETEDFIIDINCTLVQNDEKIDLSIFFILPKISLDSILERADALLGN